MRCGQILSLSLRGRQLHANKSCEIGAKIIQAEERQEGSQSQAFQPIFSTTHDLEEKEAPAFHACAEVAIDQFMA